MNKKDTIREILKNLESPEDRGQFITFSKDGGITCGETGKKTKGKSIEFNNE